MHEETIKWLNKVRREGLRLARYDIVSDEGYDETRSVFVYKYLEDADYIEVVIFMDRGEYINYYRR